MDEQIFRRRRDFEEVRNVLKESNKYTYQFDRFHLDCTHFEGEAFDEKGSLKVLNLKQLCVFLVLAETSLVGSDDDKENGFSAKNLSGYLNILFKQLREDVEKKLFELKKDDKQKLKDIRFSEEDVRSIIFSLKDTFKRPETARDKIITSGYKLTVNIKRELTEKLKRPQKTRSLYDEKPHDSPRAEPPQNVLEMEESPASRKPEDVATAAPVPVERKNPFNRWLISKWWITLTFILVVAFSIFATFGYEGATENDFYSNATLNSILAHILMLSGVLLYLLSKSYRFKNFRDEEELKKDVEANERVKKLDFKDVKEFHDAGQTALTTHHFYMACWVGILSSWVFLYCVFGVATFQELSEFHWLRRLSANLTESASSPAFVIGLLKNAVNNIQTVFLFLSFYILYDTTELEKAGRYLRRVLILALILVFVPLVVDSHYLFFQKKEVPLLSILFSGIIAGVAMALYTGRFQSKFLYPPLWLLVSLYFYIVIQPLYVFVSNPQFVVNSSLKTIEPIILHFALFSKCLLILYMLWAFESGRLLFYLIRLRRTKDQVEDEWATFQKFLK